MDEESDGDEANSDNEILMKTSLRTKNIQMMMMMMKAIMKRKVGKRLMRSI